MKKLATAAIASTFLLLHAACDDTAHVDELETNPQEYLGGSLVGHLGDIDIDLSEDDTTPPFSVFESDPYFDSLSVFADDQEGNSAMLLVSTDAALNSLPIGATIHVKGLSFVVELPRGEAPVDFDYIDVVGCSGEVNGDWNTDENALTATIRVVDDADGGRTLSVDAHFDEGDRLSAEIPVAQSVALTDEECEQ